MALMTHACLQSPSPTGLPEIVSDRLAGGHPLRGAVLTLGNFDGFHLGHQGLNRMAQRLAMGSPVAVMACEPHPRDFFRRQDAPFRLATPASRRRELGHYGVDFIYSPAFDHAFAALSPQEFVERILVDALGIRHVIAGADFRFGHRRQGDMALLAKLCAACGIDVGMAPDVVDAGERISSTLIRTAIKAGELQKATQLLGHGWLVETSRTCDGNLRLHGSLCRPRPGRYLGHADQPDGRGEQICIEITADGDFLPLAPQPIRSAPQMWRLEKEAAAGLA